MGAVEKHFGLKSKEAAWIYSGNEISQICFIVFVPVVGRIVKKPLAMSLMSVVAGWATKPNIFWAFMVKINIVTRKQFGNYARFGITYPVMSRFTFQGYYFGRKSNTFSY